MMGTSSVNVLDPGSKAAPEHILALSQYAKMNDQFANNNVVQVTLR